MQPTGAASNDASSGTSTRRGSDVLERRSRLMRKLVDHVHVSLVHIIDDSRFDAAVLTSNLRKIFSRDVGIATTTDASGLRTLWSARLPDLVFVDDRLGRAATAVSVIPEMRRIGFAGPVVAVSGLLTRQRRAELIRAGASGVLHKDDYDSLQLLELLLAVFGVDATERGNPL